MTRIRLLTSLVMAPVAIAAILLLPTGWMMALAAVVLLLGLWEWLELSGVEDSLARSALLAAHLAVMVGLVWASRSGEGLSLVLFLLASFLGVAWWLASLLWLRNFNFASTPDGYSRMIKLAAGALAMIPAWAAVGYIHGGEPHGDRWLLVALFVVWGADTGAYFVGRRFGRRKLAPRVSPNKTLEGLAGGLLVGVGVGLLVALSTGIPAPRLPGLALVCVVAALFSVVGDLFESLLKRHAGVKDSGRLIPGHGGVLDRVDGVLAALPAFAVGKAMLGL